MENALIQLLLGNPAVVAALGDRINWGRKPQDVRGYPYVTLQVVTADPSYTTSGNVKLRSHRVQFDVYGETYLSTLQAYRAIRDLLSGFKGVVGDVTFGGIFQDSERDLPAADAGDVTVLFRKSTDFIIWHS